MGAQSDVFMFADAGTSTSSIVDRYGYYRPGSPTYQRSSTCPGSPIHRMPSPSYSISSNVEQLSTSDNNRPDSPIHRMTSPVYSIPSDVEQFSTSSGSAANDNSSISSGFSKVILNDLTVELHLDHFRYLIRKNLISYIL